MKIASEHGVGQQLFLIAEDMRRDVARGHFQVTVVG